MKPLIMDTLEYGRVMHAEMCALTDAARNGLAVKEGKLFCNTFPCHNCAKHIVGAGISEVIYQKPYPKSAVAELYPDSIEIDPPVTKKDTIIFRQFLGIGSNRYRLLFSKRSNKNSDGSVREFVPSEAHPLRETYTNQYLQLEAAIVSSAGSKTKETK